MVWAAQPTASLVLVLKPARNRGFVVRDMEAYGDVLFAGSLVECLAYMGDRHLGPEYHVDVALSREPIPPNRMDT